MEEDLIDANKEIADLTEALEKAIECYSACQKARAEDCARFEVDEELSRRRLMVATKQRDEALLKFSRIIDSPPTAIISLGGGRDNGFEEENDPERWLLSEASGKDDEGRLYLQFEPKRQSTAPLKEKNVKKLKARGTPTEKWLHMIEYLSNKETD